MHSTLDQIHATEIITDPKPQVDTPSPSVSEHDESEEKTIEATESEDGEDKDKDKDTEVKKTTPSIIETVVLTRPPKPFHTKVNEPDEEIEFKKRSPSWKRAFIAGAAVLLVGETVALAVWACRAECSITTEMFFLNPVNTALVFIAPAIAAALTGVIVWSIDSRKNHSTDDPKEHDVPLVTRRS